MITTTTRRLELVRPLLSLTRRDTAAVAAAAGLPVWEDSTNSDAGVARRNRLRLQLMPVLQEQFGPGLERRLAGRAAVAWAEWEALAPSARRLLRAARRPCCPLTGVVPERPDASGHNRKETKQHSRVEHRNTYHTVALDR